MRQTCGYQGHYCHVGSVQFISRAFGVNDYCVDGVRVSVSDAGEVSRDEDAPNAVERILAFERAKYEADAEWLKARDIDIGPFDNGIIRAANRMKGEGR